MSDITPVDGTRYGSFVASSSVSDVEDVLITLYVNGYGTATTTITVDVNVSTNDSKVVYYEYSVASLKAGDHVREEIVSDGASFNTVVNSTRIGQSLNVVVENKASSGCSCNGSGLVVTSVN